MYCIADGNQRLPEVKAWGRFGLHDRYAMCDSEIHCHIEWAECEGGEEASKYCTVLNRTVLHDLKPWARNGTRNIHDGSQGDVLDGVQFSVFVYVVQLGENPQWMLPGLLPSVVRLPRLYEFPHFGRYGVKSSGLVGGLIIPGGEGDSLWTRWRVATLYYRSEPNHVVEDSTKIVETVPKQGGEFGEWWSTYFRNIPNTIDHA